MGLAPLKDCKNLAQLILQGLPLSDADLEALAALPTSIVDLDLYGTRISLQGYDQLRQAMPNCVIQWREPNRLAAEHVLAPGGTVEIGPLGKDDRRLIKSADALPRDLFQVRRIVLKHHTLESPEFYANLATLRFPEFDRLESIDLTGTNLSRSQFGTPIAGLKELILVGCPGIGTCCESLHNQAGLRRLILDHNLFQDRSWLQFPELEELSMANTGLSDEFLMTLPKLPKLKRLVLDNNPLLGRTLGQLHNQPELTDLSLNCPSIGDLLGKNLGHLKRLQHLSLIDANLSDTGIRHLEGLTELQALNLTGTKVTAAGVAALQKALPKCTITWQRNDKDRGKK